VVRGGTDFNFAILAVLAGGAGRGFATRSGLIILTRSASLPGISSAPCAEVDGIKFLIVNTPPPSGQHGLIFLHYVTTLASNVI
jgi:hypothetical protein